MNDSSVAAPRSHAPVARVGEPPRTRGRLRRNRPAVFALLTVAAISGVAILAPWLAPYDPAEQLAEGLSPEGRPLPPTRGHWLGTDLLGRDLLSRLVHGARVSLLIGVVANGVALAIGTVLGTMAGYFTGWIRPLFLRFTDMMMAFPALLLAIALAAILRPSLWIVAMVIALINWVWIARVVYVQVLALSGRDFIEAARAVGASGGRLLSRHFLPHLIPTLLVWGSLGISTTVLFEAALSFLGVGVRPPTPSWGGIINESQSYFLDAPWLVAFPGLAILVTSLAFNVFGDGLRDALDPQMRGR